MDTIKKTYGLTDKQAAVLVGLLRYLPWIESGDNRQSIILGPGRLGVPRKGYATFNQLSYMWYTLGMERIRVGSYGMALRHLSAKGYVKIEKHKSPTWSIKGVRQVKKEYFTLTTSGRILAELLEVRLTKEGLVKEFK